jgi:hypothetical protein
MCDLFKESIMFKQFSLTPPVRIALAVILAVSTLTFVIYKVASTGKTPAPITSKSMPDIYGHNEDVPYERAPLPEDLAARSERSRNKGFISSGESVLSLMDTFSCSAVTSIPQTECEALVALFNSTNGGMWEYSGGWFETDDPCEWSGVYCLDGHVEELWLYKNNMTGPIPPELGNLPYLTHLDLGFNYLLGNVPEQIWFLTRLEVLMLDVNQLTGTIPNDIGNLRDLQFLDLNSNEFTGPIPPAIGNLFYLSTLDISYNHFYGEIPFSITSLVNLLPEWTDINYNHLYSTSSPVIAFLNKIDTYWQDTQKPLGTFFDVLPGFWAESFIDAIYAAGITGGCKGKPILFCPAAHVYRGDMAIFLERGMNDKDFSPPAATGIFTDVLPSAYYASWVEQLYEDGITGGCSVSPLMYCPSAKVSRAQMAVFLLKAKHGKDYQPPAATGKFSDVPQGSFFEPWIEQLAEEGITAGCGAGIYCPSSPVTRAQMAVFLTRTFDLDIP